MFGKLFAKMMCCALALGVVMFWMACGKSLGTEGALCQFDGECSTSLKCIRGKCGFDGAEGTPCTLPTECGEGLQCISRRCTRGAGSCQSQTDCPQGLQCIDSKCITPGDEGKDCTDQKACASPLICSSQGKCAKAGAAGTKGEGSLCAGDDDCRKGMACDPKKTTCTLNGSEGLPCNKDDTCSGTLICNNSNVCAPKGSPGTGSENDPCKNSEDCRKGFTCGTGGVCKTAGAGEEGMDCAGNENCRPGLVCGTPQEGTSNVGKCSKSDAPGTKPGGSACTESKECGFGLLCDLSNVCSVPRPFEGVKCASDDDITGVFRVFFEVPRKDTPVTEFYRLPFPNNIRLKDDGKIDLSGHPSPDPLAEENILNKYIKAIQEEMTGFGTNQTIYFRFSKPLNFESLKLNNEKPSLLFVNLDTKGRVGLSVLSTPGRARYICQNSLSVKTFSGAPLEHGQTYAVLVTRNLNSNKNDLISRDKDFDTLMKDEVPTDEALKAAHAKYQKLRDFLKDNKANNRFPGPDDVVAAAVFTTHDPDANFQKFRTVIESQPKPALKELTLCDGKTKSPCESDGFDAATRKCPDTPSSDFDEYHAKIALPIFQAGALPYQTQGGEIRYEADGTPKLVTLQDVCVSLTVPKGTAPAKGWPIVLYSHGTGANFRGHVTNKTAQQLANITTADGKKVQFATIGFEQVMHGPRRGDSKVHPNFLFFNFRNPHAAKNNTVQAAVDHFTLARLLQDLKIPASQSPDQKEITFDKDHVAFLGHSQGGIVGPLFLAYEPTIPVAVLSGAGGNLTLSLLGKTKPVNVTAGVQLALGETSLNARHPALNLIQLYFERADASNYAHLLVRKPFPAVGSKHIFQTYGLGDTFTPPATMRALAIASGFQLIKPELEKIGFIGDPIDTPAKGNVTVNQKPYTAVVAQYKPADYDGHFVLFQHPDALKQYTQFLASWITDTDGVPSVVKAP